jgi:predicted MFS family arabinose efflux permease
MHNASHTRAVRLEEVPGWRITAAGLCASLVGIGIGRFAYTPLIPAIIGAHWFSASMVFYLGAANLAGYLAGVLLTRPAAHRIKSTSLLRSAMLLATIACFACAVPMSLSWYFAWRFAAGLSGGVIMVLAASVVLPHTQASRRGIVSGVIFSGVGLGVAASGTLVPLLLRAGLPETWCGLGALSALLTVASWSSWPRHAAATPERTVIRTRRHPPHVHALLLEYGLNAAALVPHMVFLVDFVARGLGRGVNVGSDYWVIYGLGAVVGPLLTGHLADRAGFAAALRLAYLVQAAAIAIPLVTTGFAGLLVSSLVVGAFTPGIVPLVLGRIHELIPHDAGAQRAAWSRVTASFAVFQAVAAYGFSYLFANAGRGYVDMFAIGACAVALALLIDLVVAVTGRGAGRFHLTANLP